MALYLENKGKVFFRNGLPSSIFWQPEVLKNDITPDDLQNQADAELRTCGFRVKVGEVKFEEDNQVLFARVWWQ